MWACAADVVLFEGDVWPDIQKLDTKDREHLCFLLFRM